MKKIIFTLLCLIGSLGNLIAETITKHEIVVDTDRFQGAWYQGVRPRVTNYTVSASFDYDNDMNLIGNPRFGLIAHDDNYDYSDETATLFVGSASELLSLINKAIDFLSKAETGMSLKDNGYKLLVGDGKISIQKANDRAYHFFKEKELKNIKKKTEDYCKKKGILIE